MSEIISEKDIKNLQEHIDYLIKETKDIRSRIDYMNSKLYKTKEIQKDQRVGKLCYFWDNVSNKKNVSILKGIESGVLPFLNERGELWEFCELYVDYFYFAPDWAKYCAMNSTEDWFWYEKKPEISAHGYGWYNSTDTLYCQAPCFPKVFNFKESLQIRSEQ